MRQVVFFTMLLGCAVLQAQVYTWTDDKGRTHYGDSPPEDQTAQELEIDSHNVSTVGASGLRPGEMAMLDQIREDEIRNAELRTRRLELERIEAERQRAQREASENAIDEDSNTRYGEPYYYYPFPYDYYGHRERYDRDRADIKFRLRAQFGDNELEINPKPRRQWRDRPHRDQDRLEFRHRTHRKPAPGVRHGVAE